MSQPVTPAETPENESASPSASQEEPRSERAAHPRWWHRDHPTFTALAGFYTGLLFIILVPGIYLAILNLFLDTDTTDSLLPFGALLLLIPIGLAAWPRTRRFGLYVLVGILTTVLVVAIVAAIVLWVLVTLNG